MIRDHGALALVDGAQAVGQMQVDVKEIGCDAYVGCFHKWMLAPAGTGFLFLRENRARDVWTTLASTHWNDHADDGYRLSQRGTGSMSPRNHNAELLPIAITLFALPARGGIPAITRAAADTGI